MNPQDDLQSRLNNSIYGAPQTNPDERRHYLGSLRERVALRLTNEEMTKPACLPAFKTALGDLEQDKTMKILLNGKLPSPVTQAFMPVIAASTLPFTMVNDDTANTTPEGSGLLVVAPDAIDQEDVSLTYPEETEPPKKKGLFGLF